MSTPLQAQIEERQGLLTRDTQFSTTFKKCRAWDAQCLANLKSLSFKMHAENLAIKESSDDQATPQARVRDPDQSGEPQRLRWA